MTQTAENTSVDLVEIVWRGRNGRALPWEGPRHGIAERILSRSVSMAEASAMLAGFNTGSDLAGSDAWAIAVESGTIEPGNVVCVQSAVYGRVPSGATVKLFA